MFVRVSVYQYVWYVFQFTYFSAYLLVMVEENYYYFPTVLDSRIG